MSLLASSFAPEGPSDDDVLLPVRGMTRAGRYASFLEQLERHTRGVRYDVVHAMLPVRHCDVYHPHAGLAAEAVGRGHLKHDSPIKRAVAKVATGLNQRRQRFAAVERALLTAAEPPVVLCLSDYIKSVARAHYPLAESSLATLFNAVDLRKFDPAARPETRGEVRGRLGVADDRVVALMIAQDFERKGLREAIAALARVADPRLVLLVVGRQNPEPYRQMARRAGVEGRVIFAGATADPYAFYRAADFFVLPTRHDPCSLVVLEALAMGLPVISTKFNGACEIMTEGRHGYVMEDPADVGALAARMTEMLDAGRRGAMSAHCLELRPALSYEHHLDRLVEIYGRAARARG